MTRVLVTGASGFVGRAMCSTLLSQGYGVNAGVRYAGSIHPPLDGLDTFAVGEVSSHTDWSAALRGVDCIIHCAAKTDLTYETKGDALAEYRAVNVAGTRRLAVQAAAMDVRRFVFLSSIKVYGEHTLPGKPFVIDEFPGGFAAPSEKPGSEDPYGVSKLEAERVLWEISEQTGLELVVVRSPLVYGPGVKGNLLRLLSWVARGVPLPLGAVRNQRSLLGLLNLVDLLLRCVEHPAAAGRTFLGSDGQDLSTTQLIRLMAEGMNRPVRLPPVPLVLLQAGGTFLGRRREIDRLVGSLQVNCHYTQTQLAWNPPLSVEDGVREMALWYVHTLGERSR